MMFVLDVFCAQNLNTGMSKNQIQKASSLKTGIQNKGPILKAINLLQEGLILDSKKVNKQREMITLTPLGQEIIDFINDLLRCNKSRQELKKTISEYEKNDHVDSYHKVRDSLYSVLNLYNSQIYNCIIHRYSLIVDEFEVNQIAKDILNKTILDQVMREISIDNQDEGELQDDWSPSDYTLLSRSVLGDISKLYYDYDRVRVHIDHYFTSRFTTAAVTKLISSMLILLKPARTGVDFALNRVLSGDTLSPDILEVLKDDLQKTRNKNLLKYNELREISRIVTLDQERDNGKTDSQLYD